MNLRQTIQGVLTSASLAIAAMTVLWGQAVTPAAPLGPGDVIAIHALHCAELSKESLRLGEDGVLELPMVGPVKAAGLTPMQLAAEIRKRLDEFVKEPQVTVDVIEVKSRPVSVMGAVKSPGVYQIAGSKRLLDVLAAAGGADESSGSIVNVSRPKTTGAIALPEAQLSGDYYTARVSLPEIVEGKRPDANFFILPGDVITVPRAKLVYVIGEVHKSGGFVLRDRQSMSVLQAVSMAEGLTNIAGSSNARIIRPAPDTEAKVQIPVNLKNILAGKAPDVPMQPDDVLFVPNSAARNATLRAIETAIQMGTGLVIWRVQ